MLSPLRVMVYCPATVPCLQAGEPVATTLTAGSTCCTDTLSINAVANTAPSFPLAPTPTKAVCDIGIPADDPTSVYATPSVPW